MRGVDPPAKWLAGGIVAFAILILGAVGAALFFANRLLQEGAGPRERGLRQAIVDRDVAAAKAALAAGADPNAAVPVQEDDDSYGWKSTAWLVVEEMAGRSGLPGRGSQHDPQLLEIARAVFAAGGNPNDSWSRSGSRVLSTTGPPNLRYLIEEAVLSDNGALIEVMVAAGLDLQSFGTGQALVQSCRAGQDDAAAALIRAGANVNHRERISLHTPLSEAVHHRRTALIALLEERGALEWGASPQR